MTRSAITRIIIGVLLLAAGLLILTWAVGGFEGLSGHGIGALIAGTLISLAVGIGLMAVIFASSRSGHDQAVHDAAKAHFPDPSRDDSVAGQR